MIRKNTKLEFIALFIIIIAIITMKVFSNRICVVSNTNNIIFSDKISLMSTDKNYILKYETLNTYTKERNEIFNRKNNNYSDFYFDEENNILYYSNITNAGYDMFQVNLTNKKEIPLFKGLKCYPDTFDINGDTLVIRTTSSDRRRLVIGKCSLSSKGVELFENFDSDSNLYTFYWNKNNNAIYTIERSVKEEESVTFPDIPTHHIYRYSLDGKNRDEIHSLKQWINDISVNSNGDKLLLGVTSFDSNIPITEIILVDANTKESRFIIKGKKEFKGINFDKVTKPQFSLYSKGFYFLGTTDKSVIIEKPIGTEPVKCKNIYFYNFESNDIELIYETNNSVINMYKVN